MSPPGRQPTTAAVKTTASVYEVAQKTRDHEEREKSRISDGRSAKTSAFAHLPTLRRDVLVRAAVRRSSTLGSRMGQKQTLAPITDSGSCDRQIWRIIKMKLPTDQTAKSETKGLCCSIVATRWRWIACRACVVWKGKIAFGWCCGKVALAEDSLKL